MNYYEKGNAMLVHEITLLFLCKTATKKTLWLKPDNGGNYFPCVYLDCELDEDTIQNFYVVCKTEQAAKELEKECVNWLNY